MVDDPRQRAGADSGPQLVLVPGLGLRPGAWHPTTELLRRSAIAADTRVVALPGYGLPAQRRTVLTPHALGRRLAALLPADRPVVLCGHSASCQLVAHAAVESAACGGSEVVGMVLVGPTTDPRSRSWPGLAKRWLATARHEPPWQVPVLVGHYRQTGLTSIARAMDAARRDSIEATLAQVGCPVLLLRGSRDRIAPADWLATLASSRPNAESRHAEVSGGGHMVPLTHGPQVARLVRRFLAAEQD